MNAPDERRPAASGLDAADQALEDVKRDYANGLLSPEEAVDRTRQARDEADAGAQRVQGRFTKGHGLGGRPKGRRNRSPGERELTLIRDLVRVEVRAALAAPIQEPGASGRVAAKPRCALNITLDPDLKARLARCAALRGCTEAWIVRLALERYIAASASEMEGT